MSSRNTRIRVVAPIAGALLLMPLSLFSQSAPPPAQVEEWIVELNHIQMQLAPLEERALQDPTLAEQQQALGDDIRAAMIAADATVEAKLTRLREIMVAAQAAGGDMARLDALAAEAQSLQPAIERARGIALAQPEVEAKFKNFRKNLCDRMAQIDPASVQLVTRFEELERLIRSSLRQGATSPVGPARSPDALRDPQGAARPAA